MGIYWECSVEFLNQMASWPVDGISKRIGVLHHCDADNLLIYEGIGRV